MSDDLMHGGCVLELFYHIEMDNRPLMLQVNEELVRTMYQAGLDIVAKYGLELCERSYPSAEALWAHVLEQRESQERRRLAQEAAEKAYKQAMEGDIQLSDDDLRRLLDGE